MKRPGAARIEQRLSQPEHVPMTLVAALARNAVAVLEEYVDPATLEAALDKLRHLTAASRCTDN